MPTSGLDKTVECVKTDSLLLRGHYFHCIFVLLKGKAILIKIVSKMNNLEKRCIKTL